MSSDQPARDGPAQRQEPPSRNTAALAGFLSYLLEGSVTLLAPSLRELAALSPAPAEVDIDILKSLKINDTPLDVAFASKHNYIYVLTDKGQILVFDPSGRQLDQIEVGRQFDQMRVVPGADVLFLTSRKNRLVQIVQLGFVQQINTSDSPSVGPASVTC